MSIIIITIEMVLLGTLSFVLLYQGFFVLTAFIQRHEAPFQTLVSNYRFAVLIPAHNEEFFIDRCLNSVLSAHYHKNLCDVYVIADNCTDRTIEKASLHPIVCLERNDDSNKGKGYAIEWAIKHIVLDTYGAVLFLDADAVVSHNIFLEISKALSYGEKAIQVYNGTLNTGENWLTRLFHLSDVLQYLLYFRGREAYGLTCKLIGNGMCLKTEVLKKVPWSAFSITENWEYYLKVLLEGYRIAFVGSASANSDQITSFIQGKTQRIRWHAGWSEAVRKFLPRIISAAWRGKKWRLADAAIDFLLPSPSIQAFIMGVVVIGLVFVEQRFLYWWTLALGLIAAALAGLSLVVARAGYKDYVAVCYAPFYIIWKVFLRICLLVSAKPTTWVRTLRKSEHTAL